METAIIAILGAIFLAWLWRREPSGLSDEGHPPPSEARRSSLAARAVSAGSTSVAQTGSSPDWTLSPRMGGTPERWGLGLDDPWHDDDTLHHQHAFRHEYLDSSISQPSIFDDTFDSLTGTSAFYSFDDPMRMSDPFEH